MINKNACAIRHHCRRMANRRAKTNIEVANASPRMDVIQNCGIWFVRKVS